VRKLSDVSEKIKNFAPKAAAAKSQPKKDRRSREPVVLHGIEYPSFIGAALANMGKKL
jgi:hypothetical protein